MSFTFIKTDQFMTPNLAPTMILVTEDKFDLDLFNKAGRQINGFFTKNGEECWAYEPKADSGYAADTVIVRITTYEQNHAVLKPLCPSASGETYLFKREDWDKVYAIGIAKQPAAKRPAPDSQYVGGGMYGN